MNDPRLINFAGLSDAATAAELAIVSTAPQSAAPDAAPFVMAPAGYAVVSVEHTLPEPVRAHGTITVHDARSFCELVAQLRDSRTRLYGLHGPQPTFVAVLNDHQRNSPAWRDHRVAYNCPLSREWKTWTATDGKAMSQAEFARWMEDNAIDCVEPAAADMIEIARSLEAKKKVNFASGVRLSDGQTEFTYEEEIKGTAAKGKLQIPEVFVVALPPLEGGARYRLDARLRYRIDSGRLVMWFDLLRPHKVLEHAASEVWGQIATTLGCQIINGAA